MTMVGDERPEIESHTESVWTEYKKEPKRYRCAICGTWYYDKREAAECKRACNERFRLWQEQQTRR